MMTYEEISKSIQRWKSSYTSNNSRGESCIDFVTSNNQWEAATESDRESLNKETLTLNNSIKYLNRAINQARQIDFSLDIMQRNSEYDMEECNAFKLFVKHMYNSKENNSKFFNAYEKAMNYGYSVAFIRYGRESEFTLNQLPYIKIMEDPSCCFFDVNAKTRTKTDGNYSGYMVTTLKDDLIDMSPNFEDNKNVLDSNEVIYYFFRKKKKGVFTKFKSGEYKLSSLITMQDKDNFELDEMGNPITKKDWVSEIFMRMYLNKEQVGKTIKYPSNDLPFVYHPMLTSWTPKTGANSNYETYPYTFYMKGAQRLHNFVMSQIATVLKFSSATKWLFRPEHLQNEDNKDHARNINGLEGGLVFPGGADLPPPVKVPPDEIPMSLMQMGQQTNAEIDSISGAMMEMQPSDNVNISGKAMREFTKNIQMMNTGLVASHIEFISECCKIITQILVNIVTEQRLLCVKDNNGKMVDVIINKKDASGNVIKNDIKDLQNSFYYEVVASPNQTMQDENTVMALQTMYQFNPQLFSVTGDILMESLDIPKSAELAKRIRATMDQDLLAYGNGEISDKQFQEIKAKKAQKQKQEMEQQQQPIIQAHAQAAKGMAQAEIAKAQAANQDAATNKAKAESDALDKQTKNELALLKINNDQLSAEQRIELEGVKANLEHQRTLVDSILNRGSLKNAST